MPGRSRSATYGRSPSTVSSPWYRGSDAPTPPVSSNAGSPSPRRARAISSIASMIFTYPVQRQRCTSMAAAICARVGLGVLSSRCLARSANPGIQKPHWTPAAETKACAVSCRSSVGRPSSVSTLLPSHFSVGVAHVTFACPSMIARQHPHWPCGWHPSFTDFTPQRSRRASRSDSPGTTSRSCARPFTVRWMVPIAGHHTRGVPSLIRAIFSCSEWPARFKSSRDHSSRAGLLRESTWLRRLATSRSRRTMRSINDPTAGNGARGGGAVGWGGGAGAASWRSGASV